MSDKSLREAERAGDPTALAFERMRHGIMRAEVSLASPWSLCFIDSPWAWFTTQPVKGPRRQSGDGWYKSPYQHNACDPYQEPGHGLLCLAFESEMETPAGDHLSVDDINDGLRPWLRTPGDHSGPTVEIMAGASLFEFMNKITLTGGRLWLPMAG